MQRWEIELGFREIRQGLLHDAPVLRSKQPERVGQEWWSTLLAYDLIRQAMRRMPDEMHVGPQCLSFQWLTLAIMMALTGGSLDDAETLSERLQLLRKLAARCSLPHVVWEVTHAKSNNAAHLIQEKMPFTLTDWHYASRGAFCFGLLTRPVAPLA